MIAFDFKEALSFEGETGPYCQYAAVRANSIFRKLDVRLACGCGIDLFRAPEAMLRFAAQVIAERLARRGGHRNLVAGDAGAAA